MWQILCTLCDYAVGSRSAAESSEAFRIESDIFAIDGLKRAHAATVAVELQTSAIISAAPTFPLSHQQVSLCSRLEKQREDGESLMTLHLLAFPLLHSGGRKPHWFRHISSLTKKEERHISICLGQARPRWGKQMLPQLHIVNRKWRMLSALPPVV